MQLKPLTVSRAVLDSCQQVGRGRETCLAVKPPVVRLLILTVSSIAESTAVRRRKPHAFSLGWSRWPKATPTGEPWRDTEFTTLHLLVDRVVDSMDVFKLQLKFN